MTADQRLEIHDVQTLAVGAVGPPGQRTFMIEAASESQRLVVVVEKEQVAMLVREATQFLDQVGEEYPEDRVYVDPSDSVLVTASEPLFRARMIGLGFDPESGHVLLELREELASDDAETDVEHDPVDEDLDELDGWIARAYASRAQLRALIATGAEAVMAGRSRWN